MQPDKRDRTPKEIDHDMEQVQAYLAKHDAKKLNPMALWGCFISSGYKSGSPVEMTGGGTKAGRKYSA